MVDLIQSAFFNLLDPVSINLNISAVLQRYTLTVQDFLLLIKFSVPADLGDKCHFCISADSQIEAEVVSLTGMVGMLDLV